MFSVIFPGQGSQLVGMGKEFFEKYDIVKNLFKEADEVLRFNLSKDFIDVIPEDKVNDHDYVKEVVARNKKVSRQIRKEIRRYGIDTFGLENILAYEYIPKLESLLT